MSRGGSTVTTIEQDEATSMDCRRTAAGYERKAQSLESQKGYHRARKYRHMAADYYRLAADAAGEGEAAEYYAAQAAAQ